MSNENERNSIFFPRKLTGNLAKLFAKACNQYLNAVENECNDTPSEIPIFSWLSPQHRTFLVSKLAVGLLCEDEPLPPQTIEYGAAYFGVVATIKCELMIEIDTSVDEVGQDLIKLYYEPVLAEECLGREENSTARSFEQRTIDMSLIGKEARKNKKKLDRKIDSEQRESGGHHSKVANKARIGIFDHLEESLSSWRHIFEGGKCPESIRRPPRLLTDDEKGWGGFQWRLSVDEALQEDSTHIGVIRPLSNLNFCWNCFDFDKWDTALSLLMKTYYMHLNPGDSALIFGDIDDLAYADKTHHDRILAVQKIVRDLRDAFDPHFDVKKGAYPQRLIFAVCTVEMYHGRANCSFARKFLEVCKERGINLEERGDFQMRYEVFNTVSEQVLEGLDKSYSMDIEFKSPGDYKSKDGLYFGIGCTRNGCYSFAYDEMKYCSNCRVVKYCSKECQKADWKKHKMQCKTLAASRKDKQKIQEALRTFKTR
uniref:MYND-type domain-containing protein n=1 Tax=Leptocylindrus danicus TaxID=163516 RepID=A0A7S2K7D0_9STRA